MTGEQVSTIQVYRDDPIWNSGKRWFQHPLEKLDELYVTCYEVRGVLVTVSDVRQAAREVRKLHPDCILVHI